MGNKGDGEVGGGRSRVEDLVGGGVEFVEEADAEEWGGLSAVWVAVSREQMSQEAGKWHFICSCLPFSLCIMYMMDEEKLLRYAPDMHHPILQLSIDQEVSPPMSYFRDEIIRQSPFLHFLIDRRHNFFFFLDVLDICLFSQPTSQK